MLFCFWPCAREHRAISQRKERLRAIAFLFFTGNCTLYKFVLNYYRKHNCYDYFPLRETVLIGVFIILISLYSSIEILLICGFCTIFFSFIRPLQVHRVLCTQFYPSKGRIQCFQKPIKIFKDFCFYFYVIILNSLFHIIFNHAIKKISNKTLWRTAISGGSETYHCIKIVMHTYVSTSMYMQ